MEFRILGPLEAWDGDRLVDLGGTRERTVLAILLLHENEVVSTDRLIDELWGGGAPGTARTALQGYVSRLRRALGPASRLLVTRSPGYLLQVAPGRLDSDCFETLLAAAQQERAGGDQIAAAEPLREALALWRGDALVDFRYEPFAQNEIGRLEELHLLAFEARIDLDLAEGRGADLVSELEVLVARHPLRERFRGQLMLSLYRAGRQAEALAAYQNARRVLVEELGIEPSPELQHLEREILCQAPALDAPVPERGGVAVAETPRDVRKNVTVAAVALGHSATAGGPLDPEVLVRVRARSVEAVSAVLERHGGTVAGVGGELLVGVFGIPILHEDDALRAVRAAVEANEMLPALTDELESTWRARVVLRTGIATGEVAGVAAAGGEELLAAEVVAGAMRLAERLAPGEVAVAEPVRRLTEDAVQVEPLETSDGGGAEAWRLVGLTPGAPAFARRLDAALVGRERELAQLREAFARSMRGRTPHLVTVLGPAGIGKSRLAAELPALVGEEARVLRGRCLPYGEGITFWPLQEIVREAVGDAPLETLFECLGGSEEADLVTELIAAALGLEDGRPASEEETFWAVCRLVEAIARELPLVVVLEDLHWAEPTFLDLVEHLAGRSCDAPVLIVCLARPELLESRTHWGGGMPNATSLFLEPLFPEEAEHLLDDLLGGAAFPRAMRARIGEAAEGNPLFLEQLLAMARETDCADGELPIPPTIEALLAARLDRLGPGERAVLDRASVIGKEFLPEAVVDLLPEEAHASAGRHLEALVAKELIRPARGRGGGEAYRFRHLLIQQAAYRGVPKELRADLHERFAAWLADRAGERVIEVEEIVGYHLEQAYLYRDELGPVDEARALAAAAAERLGAAGRRARARGDASGAVKLLGRTSALLDRDDPMRPEVMSVLGGALFEAGELGRAEAVLEESLLAAEEVGDLGLRAHVLLRQAFLLIAMGAESGESLELARRTIPLFEELQDDAGLARAFRLVGEAEMTQGRVGRAGEDWERGLAHAQAAGDRHERSELLCWLTMALGYGPTAVPEALGRLEWILAEAEGDRRVLAGASIVRGLLVAMERRFDEAREQIAAGKEILEQLGLRIRAAMAPRSHLGYVELLAGDPAAAEEVFRSGYEALEELGEKAFLSTISANLAEALYAQGAYEEAERYTEVSEAAAALDDVASQIGWRACRAKVVARRGDRVAARALAAEAVALAEQTDMVDSHADALVALAEVLRLTGSPAAAVRPLEAAAALYDAKGNLVLAEDTRARLENREVPA